jgi:hypothetical protein
MSGKQHKRGDDIGAYSGQKNQRFQVIVNGCEQSTSSLAKPLRGFTIRREYEALGKPATTD